MVWYCNFKASLTFKYAASSKLWLLIWFLVAGALDFAMDYYDIDTICLILMYS